MDMKSLFNSLYKITSNSRYMQIKEKKTKKKDLKELKIGMNRNPR